MLARSRNSAGSPRLAGAALLAVVVGLVLACAGGSGSPSVASGPKRSLTAQTPHAWESRARACGDARKRARRSAERACGETSLGSNEVLCDCHRDYMRRGNWVCSAEADFVCTAAH